MLRGRLFAIGATLLIVVWHWMRLLTQPHVRRYLRVLPMQEQIGRGQLHAGKVHPARR